MSNCHNPGHGRYTHGCRCDGCREAHAVYTRNRREAALKLGTLQHGFASTYDAGCRCDACHEAKRVAYYTRPGEYKPKTGRRRMASQRRIFGTRDGAA